MSNRELASLAIRLLGVYCLVRALASVADLTLLLAIAEETSIVPLLAGIGKVLILAVMGVTMIWKSPWFARRMMRANEEARPDAEPRQLQAVLFSVIGVVLIVWAVPRITSITWTVASSGSEDKLSAYWNPDLVALVVQLVLGVALFVGSGGLARIWRRINQMNQMPQQ